MSMEKKTSLEVKREYELSKVKWNTPWPGAHTVPSSTVSSHYTDRKERYDMAEKEIEWNRKRDR